MSDPLAIQAAERPDHPALVTAERTWTYQELDQEVTTLAQHLAGANVGPGSRVACLIEPGADAVLALHATLRAGAAFAPLHTAWTDRELIDHLRTLQPHLVLCHAATEEQAAFVTQAPPAGQPGRGHPLPRHAARARATPPQRTPRPGA
ncbi:MAG: AMP-binding protein [Candidatus Thermoplasmatota archaeon]|nr:AMP-binding protein [Candidatus Thermoplasmatota archaeon]